MGVLVQKRAPKARFCAVHFFGHFEGHRLGHEWDRPRNPQSAKPKKIFIVVAIVAVLGAVVACLPSNS
jgi:hypothetical protein